MKIYPNNIFEHACYLNLKFTINRYIMSHWRFDGHEKAERHSQLCCFYIALLHGESDEDYCRRYMEEFETIHEATQELTGYLNVKIGMPLKEEDLEDHYHLERLSWKFFKEFHQIAIKCLNIEEK